MKTIKKTPMPGAKRLNVNLPIELHNSFKAAAAARGDNMTDVLLDFIQTYVDKFGGISPKKGKRG